MLVVAFLLGQETTYVDTTDGSNHLGNNDHVSQVSLDHGGLLVRSSVLLGESELLD